MKDYITLGSTPCDEPCAQVGQPNYRKQALKECRRFIELLRRKFGPEPEGAELRIKAFPHDFGTYYEVVCEFDSDLRASVGYALRCEAETPATWEEEAPTHIKTCPTCTAPLKVLLFLGITPDGYVCETCQMYFNDDLKPLARMLV
ncbi:MAG: hypothetical protein AB7P69_18935 [Candidatus Binatia bacterium]